MPSTANNSGFLLLFLLPLLLIACGILAGSLKVVKASQQRVAMQARLDICAVALMTGRAKLGRELTAGNQVIRTTALALYMIRGLKLLGGPVGVLAGSMSEAALLQLNRSASQWQNLALARYQIKELAALRCAPTPFSKSPAACFVSPPVAKATRRKPALMPDIAGTLEFVGTPLARARCADGRIQTVLRLEGDSSLTTNRFSDVYEK